MIKTLLLAFSLATFLSYLDAKVLPAPDAHRTNTESYRIEKRSSFNAGTVSIWLEGAKNNTDSTMEALGKSKAPSWLKGELQEAKEALHKVNITSAKSLSDDIRDALFLGARLLNDMLNEYNTTGKGVSETELLNAIYLVTGACIHLMFALEETIDNPTLRTNVYDATKILQSGLLELTSTSEGTAFPSGTLELAKVVLDRTRKRNHVQSTA